jgi:uncharacterized protein YhjY with autotransporter beta-barrel domain
MKQSVIRNRRASVIAISLTAGIAFGAPTRAFADGPEIFVINPAGVTINNAASISSDDMPAIAGLSVVEFDEEYGPVPFYNEDGTVGGGNVSITNSGNLSTTAVAFPTLAGLSPAGSVTITNSGSISATSIPPAEGEGNEYDDEIQSYGIFASTGWREHVQLYDENGEPTYQWEEVETPGGDVTITNTGLITTAGNNRNFGIFAESLEGNITITNGTVGNKTSAAITQTGSYNSGDRYQEGDGAAIAGGSVRGKVTINNHANVTVADNAAIAGISGSRVYDEQFDPNGSDVKITNNGDLKLGYGTGAQEGGSSNLIGIHAGSSGGKVDIENTGKIQSSGYVDSAIGAFSGFATWVWDGQNYGPVVEPGGDIKITNSGEIDIKGRTYSDEARGELADGTGIYAESIGANIDITNSGKITAGYGAIAGFTRNGGDITIANTGSLATLLDDSEMLVAEAEDGGSISITNNGALNSSASGVNAILAHSEFYDERHEDYAPTLQAAQQAAAPADTVTVKGSGNITLSGNDSVGIDITNNHGSSSVDYSGDVTVSGDNSTGIVASGNSTVSIKVSGDVTASGENSYGIVAAPDGGQDEGDAPIAMSVEVGAGSKVQGGTGPREFGFSETESGDEVLAGASGVLFVGGDTNKLTNKGTITALNGLAVSVFEGTLTFTEENYQCYNDNCEWTVAENDVEFIAGDLTLTNEKGAFILGDIVSGSGDDEIVNRGTIEGVIDLGGGLNSFVNEKDGVFNARGVYSVAAEDTLFTNAGILNPGGIGVARGIEVVGNFVQTADGRFVVDIDDEGKYTSDRLFIDGSAELAGVIVPNIVYIESGEPEGQDGLYPTKEYLIVSAEEGASNEGLSVVPKNLKVQSTLGFDFALDFRDENDVYLLATAKPIDNIVEAAVDSAIASGAAGNAQNIASVGKTLEAIEDQDVEALQPLIDALRIEADNPAEAAKVLNRLIPQNQTGQTANTAKANLSVGNTMLSCAEREGEYAYTREGKCYYAKIGARRFDRDATAAGAGNEETGYEVLGGMQGALSDQVRLGFALGYESISSDTFDTAQRLAKSDGDRFNFGAVVKNQWGPVNAYLNLTGSYTDYEHTRYVNLGPGMETAKGDQDVWSGTTRLRLTYLNEMGPWYWKPMIDLAATYIDLGGYTETGAGAANLRIASSDEWLFSVMPGLEIGGQTRTADGTILRPYARAGIIIFDDNKTGVTANFASAPAGVGPFDVTGEFDQVAADVEAGLYVLMTSGVNFKLNYEGRYGEDSQQHGGSVKVTAPY